MRHFSRILFLLTATLSSVTLSHAQTTIVTDNLAQGNPADHGAFQHWEQFSTTLSASPSATPKAEAELTLGGATYKWSGGNGVVHLTPSTSQSVGLESSLGTELKPYGQNSITVTCTITYAENDSNGKFVKNLTLPSGTINVKFYSRVPQRIKQMGQYAGDLGETIGIGQTSSQKSPFYGPDIWGQITDFSLQVQDNQPTPNPYGYCLVKESFIPPFNGIIGMKDGKPKSLFGLLDTQTLIRRTTTLLEVTS